MLGILAMGNLVWLTIDILILYLYYIPLVDFIYPFNEEKTRRPVWE